MIHFKTEFNVLYKVWDLGQVPICPIVPVSFPDKTVLCSIVFAPLSKKSIFPTCMGWLLYSYSVTWTCQDFLIILLASVARFPFSFLIFIIYAFAFFFPLILLPRNRSILLISFLPLRVYFYSVTQWHKFINNIALLPFSHCRICIWFFHVYNSCFLLLYWLLPWWFELGIDQCYYSY